MSPSSTMISYCLCLNLHHYQVDSNMISISINMYPKEKHKCKIVSISSMSIIQSDTWKNWFIIIGASMMHKICFNLYLKRRWCCDNYIISHNSFLTANDQCVVLQLYIQCMQIKFTILIKLVQFNTCYCIWFDWTSVHTCIWPEFYRMKPYSWKKT